MILYKNLDKARLGNQLFRYAFLRTQAEKLGVKFYCPHWIGEEIFNLDDKHIKAFSPKGINKIYIEPFCENRNYDRDNISIEDNSEIQGCFESEKNFDKISVRRWYSFKTEKIARVKDRYKSINFSNSVGMHCRFGDKAFEKPVNIVHFSPRIKYFIRALEAINPVGSVLVFSDDIDYAKQFLSNLKWDFIFINGNEDWEDLYLMTQCKDLICSPSTFSWWGGWLNNNQNRRIIFPKEGIFRPYCPRKNRDIIPEGWIKIPALIPIIDSYILGALLFYEVSFADLFDKVRIFIKKFPHIRRARKVHFFRSRDTSQIIRD